MSVNGYSPLWFRLFMPLQTEQGTSAELAFLARQLPLPRYQLILDLCCGYGRHALGLAARGYRVTGLDRDAAAIAEAERRAHAAQATVRYVVGDMLRLAESLSEARGEPPDGTPDMFDGAINMWQSLGYFDDATNADVLRQIHDKLAPGGRFIADIYNRAFFERNQGVQGNKRQEIDGAVVESQGYMQGDRWHSALTYRDAQGAIIGGDHYDWRVYTPEEFVALAGDCGYSARLVCAWANEELAASPEIARMQVTLERA